MPTLLTLLIYTAVPALGAGLIGFALAEMKNRWYIEEREEERRFVQAVLEANRAGGQPCQRPTPPEADRAGDQQ